MLIGHGTRAVEGTRQFFQLGERLCETLAPIPVAPCLLEFQQPTIPETWQSLVQRGVQHIHAAPLLLFAAGHAKQDIPNLLVECQRHTPEVTFDQSRPISRRAELLDLVCKRIDEALAKAGLDSTRSTALVMVGRGNRDPCAQADMRVLSELIAHRFQFSAHFTAFYALAQPSLSEVLDEVAQGHRFHSVVVHPHLLFAGRLFQSISDIVDQAASQYPRVKFQLGNYLGPEPEIAQAIAARIGVGGS
jgi:sirohydrochlorin cobaltochelatase